MRLLAPALIATMVLPVLLGAQEQERKLLDRIQRPNTEITNPMQGKSFLGSRGVEMKEAAIGRGAFAGVKSAPKKEFAGTRSFLGIKNPWFGSRGFETKSASLSGGRGLGKLDAAYPVRDAVTRSSPSSKKKASLNTADIPVRPFLVSGKTQGAFEQLSEKIHKEMTIDDIRELLNKPR
jgi:hypothetical protein